MLNLGNSHEQLMQHAPWHVSRARSGVHSIDELLKWYTCYFSVIVTNLTGIRSDALACAALLRCRNADAAKLVRLSAP